MSSIATKRKLSGSTDGKGILVTHDATADAVAVHTAVAGTTAGTFDEVWLWAYNGHTANVILTVEFAGANHSGNIIQTIPFKSGLVPILPGLILQDAETIEAFAATENVIMLFGYVNATYKNLTNNLNSNVWRISASWKAIVENNKIKHWQVYW